MKEHFKFRIKFINVSGTMFSHLRDCPCVSCFPNFAMVALWFLLGILIGLLFKLFAFYMAGQRDVLPSDYNRHFSQICHLSQNTLDQERVLGMLTAGKLGYIIIYKNQRVKTHVQVIKTKSMTFWCNVFHLMLSVFPTNFIGVIRGIFMVSAFVWITGSLLSSKRSKTE